MKRNNTYFFSSLTVLLILSTCLPAYGQDKQLQKTFHHKYQVTENVKMVINNYDCDLVIHTWDKHEMVYDMTINATLKSEEDASRLENYLDKLEVEHSPGNVEINNRFWNSRITRGMKSTMVLKGGEKVRYSRFEMKSELWIPVGSNLTLNSKYSGIELEELHGRASLNLYNDKLYGKVLGGPLHVEAKYSTLEFTETKEIRANLYNTDFETGTMGQLEIESKYSKFRTGDAGKLEIHSYSDKFHFGNTGDIHFVNKYSDLQAEKVGHLKVDGYTTTMTITSTEDIELKSKYGKYEFGAARGMNITSGYSDKMEFGSLNTLNITVSKYGTYKIGTLSTSLALKEGYSDKFTISNTGSGLKEIRMNGKYVKAAVAIDKNLSYRFEADVKYPKFEINEEEMEVRVKIKESSSLQLKAFKGGESEGMPAFIVKGYDMAFTLSENNP